MFGLRWFTASSETRTLQQTIEQAYDVGDYETITESNFTQYESLESNTQEQILLALIKSNDLLQAQDLLARTTNPSDNTRLYSKLITFTLQEDRDAVQRVAESQNSSIATIKALLFYFRALVLYNT
jgi:hypothetical protein